MHSCISGANPLYAHFSNLILYISKNTIRRWAETATTTIITSTIFAKSNNCAPSSQRYTARTVSILQSSQQTNKVYGEYILFKIVYLFQPYFAALSSCGPSHKIAAVCAQLIKIKFIILFYASWWKLLYGIKESQARSRKLSRHCSNCIPFIILTYIFNEL